MGIANFKKRKIRANGFIMLYGVNTIETISLCYMRVIGIYVYSIVLLCTAKRIHSRTGCF